MRIAHVVTLVSDDGAFGGPVSVAKTQTVELARRGHHVTLLAGWDGRGSCDVPGVDVRLSRIRRSLPTPGFSGVTAAGVLRSLWELRHDLDVVHLHLARDLVTLPAAMLTRLTDVPMVTQTHGMVMPDRRLMSRGIDFALTRPALSAAASSAYLTSVERRGLSEVARGKVRLTALRNGVPMASYAGSPRARSTPPTVIFCARLHPRKRVMAFAEMARMLVLRGSSARFVVAGPDEGDLDALHKFIDSEELSSRLTYVGALAPDSVRDALAQATIFVLPSELEPFPMTLLEALSEGVPSVITDGCTIADQVAGGAVVTDGSPEQLADAVASILDAPDRWQALHADAMTIAATTFGIRGVVDMLEDVYQAATIRPPTGRRAVLRRMLG